MYFKNLIAFDFTSPLEHNPAQLDAALAANAFVKCTAMQESTFGFVPSFKGSELFCEVLSGCYYIRAKIQTKDIKPAAINDLLIEKLDAIEADQGRRPGKKEREEIKEGIRAELLPVTPATSRFIVAIISLADSQMWVDASSEKTADDFTAHLREAIGSLQIIPAGKHESAPLLSWWNDPTNRPHETEFLNELTFIMAQDSTVKATFKNLDQDCQAIQTSIDDGMIITQAGLSFADLVTFTINEKWQIKRLKFDDTVSDPNSEDYRADVVLMIDCIRKLLRAILPDKRPESI